MFTRGFKLFFGIASAALVAALVFGFASGDTTGADYFGVLDREAFKGIISLGWQGGVGEPIGYIMFVMLAATASFLGLTMVAYRDADPESVAQLSHDGELRPADGPTPASWWPVAAAVGVGITIVGMATSKLLWQLGVGILAVVVFEWMISSWADRATGDPDANLQLRRTVMGPFELPVVSLAVIAVVAVAISRIFLTVSAAWAVWVAMGVATLILGVGALIAARPDLGKGLAGALVAIVAFGIIGAGIASAAVGEREIEVHHSDHGSDHGDEGDHGEDETGMAPIMFEIAGVTE